MSFYDPAVLHESPFLNHHMFMSRHHANKTSTSGSGEAPNKIRILNLGIASLHSSLYDHDITTVCVSNQRCPLPKQYRDPGPDDPRRFVALFEVRPFKHDLQSDPEVDLN